MTNSTANGSKNIHGFDVDRLRPDGHYRRKPALMNSP